VVRDGHPFFDFIGFWHCCSRYLESDVRATLLAPVKTGNITGVKFCLRPRLSWQLPPRTAIVAATFSAGAQHAMP
ncbi:hypothetical protein WKG84_23420, partial [Pantoea agglomerans]|uniref:hypothetical protein n=1 Tax=Enterobacter agglomerans TaxID=549 RepID=UPI003C7BB1FA